MLEIHYLSVVVAAVAAFVMSSVWNTVFGKARMELLDQDPRATADMRKVPAWKGRGIGSGTRHRLCGRTLCRTTWGR
jgi:hypothetical protein